MPATITFDGTEIRDATHVPRFVKHESAPDREIATAPRAREDGDIFIADRYGQKRVFLRGVLTGDSEPDLEEKIDAFKELFSRPERSLVVDWAGGTITLTATCARHDFDRDHFHRLFVPWTAEFTVVSGEGIGAAVVVDDDVSHNVNIAFPYEEEIAFEGSAKPKPYIRVKAGASFPSFIEGMELKHAGTGERVCVTYQGGAWGENDYFAFDFNALKAIVSKASVESDVDFYGPLPHFSVGDNDIEITLGGMVCQASFDEGDSPASLPMVDIDDEDTYRAQSFEVPYSDTTFREVMIAIKKSGNPTGNLWVRIETDDNGEPSGDLVSADSVGLINAGDVGVSTAWLRVPLDDDVALEAGTRYWIVLKPTGSTVEPANKYQVALATEDYQRGFMSTTINAGVAWTASPESDLAFSLRWGGMRAAGGSPGTFKLYVSYSKRYL